MMVVVFRNRLNPEVPQEEYTKRVEEIYTLGSKMPGFTSLKAFTADDGEVAIIVEFDNEENLAAWRNHPEHLVAQQQGRARFYAEYTLQVCQEMRKSEFDQSSSSA